MTIWFDMDGTIADLYGVEGWLDMLIASDATPYEIAKPLLRLATLARTLNQLQRKGYKIGIISWLAKNSTAEYDKAVATAKEKWLRKSLKRQIPLPSSMLTLCRLSEKSLLNPKNSA